MLPVIRKGIGPFEFNNFTFGAIGGATNINLRASQYAAGSKLTLSGSNRNYILRGMYTYSTGLMNKGGHLPDIGVSLG